MLADLAQIASAVFAAAAAAAAWIAVRHAERQAQTADAALEAQTQPLLTDIPSRDPAGQREENPSAEIRVGSNDDIAWASVPVRNVGNGTALVQTVVFVADGAEADGAASNEVVPKGELARLRLILHRKAGSPSLAMAEGWHADRQFSVLVGYADASGRPRGALRLDVQNRNVSDRRWADAVERLRQVVELPDGTGQDPPGP
jgi:hypothetical protein